MCILLLILSVGDLITTFFLSSLWGGAALEINPMISLVLTNTSWIGLSVYKLSIIIPLIIIFIKYLKHGANQLETKIVNKTIPILVIFMVAVVVYNLVGILIVIV
jgi:hypothetical protein